MSKKVIIIIVEGPSEEELLIDRLRELYSDQEIRFRIISGDPFYDINRQIQIKSELGNIVKRFINKDKLKPSDILAVTQITDTDGCFIPNDSIIVKPDQEIKTRYDLNSISVDSVKQKSYIESRNADRSRNIRLMNSLTTIIHKKYSYQIYYFSRNLEHVLFNEPNPDYINKVRKVEDFNSGLIEPVESYLKRFLPEFSSTMYAEQYSESWTFIDTKTNSLKRFNSIPLLFDFINMQLQSNSNS